MFITVTNGLFEIEAYLTIIRQGEVIIVNYSQRQSQGKYSQIITEPEANNCFVFFGAEFISISLISLSVTSTKCHFANLGFVMFTCRWASHAIEPIVEGFCRWTGCDNSRFLVVPDWYANDYCRVLALVHTQCVLSH